jgi:hypothetical protein
VRSNHNEMNAPEDPWLLAAHDSDHAVELRVSSLLPVVHERKFEVHDFTDLRLQVWTFFELADEFEAFAIHEGRILCRRRFALRNELVHGL